MKDAWPGLSKTKDNQQVGSDLQVRLTAIQPEESEILITQLLVELGFETGGSPRPVTMATLKSRSSYRADGVCIPKAGQIIRRKNKS